MKMTTASRYGLRSLVDLVANYDGTPMTLSSIAERQQVSESYLEQTFAALRRAGFVQSARGARGGYVPASGLGSVTAATVLQVLEGNLSITENTPVFHGTDPIQRSIRALLWDPVDAAILKTLQVTLQELAQEYLRMRGDAQNEIV
jgi:Rrf2 family protein